MKIYTAEVNFYSLINFFVKYNHLITKIARIFKKKDTIN